MGHLDLDLPLGCYQMCNMLQGSWERMDADTGNFDSGDLLRNVRAGDGCLFVLLGSHQFGSGSISRFYPSAGSWAEIRTSTTIEIRVWPWRCTYDRGHVYGTFNDCVQAINVSTG